MWIEVEFSRIHLRMAVKTDDSTAAAENDGNIIECNGFLKKKGRHSPKWSLVFVKVEPCVVKYGPSEEVGIA